MQKVSKGCNEMLIQTIIRRLDKLKDVFIIKMPCKSFDNIAKEYNVEFPKEFLDELADAMAREDYDRAVDLVMKFAEKNVAEEKQDAFMMDILATAKFYATLGKVIADSFKEG